MSVGPAATRWAWTQAGRWQMLWHMSESSARHVKLFTNGRNQAVRIPREFELPGEDAIMRKRKAIA